MNKIYIMNVSFLKDDKLFARALEQADIERRKKVLSYKQNGDKVRSIAADLLLRFAYKEHDSERDMPEIVYNNHGKPYFKGENVPYFNLSHSHDYVVCALSDRENGIDIEKIRPGRLRLANRFFHEEEQRYLADLQVGQEETFFKIWCLKESFVKYTGNGLGQGLASFSAVPWLCGESIQWNRKTVYGVITEPVPEYYCGICGEEDITDVCYQEVSGDNICFSGKSMIK